MQDTYFEFCFSVKSSRYSKMFNVFIELKIFCESVRFSHRIFMYIGGSIIHKRAIVIGRFERNILPTLVQLLSTEEKSMYLFHILVNNKLVSEFSIFFDKECR